MSPRKTRYRTPEWVAQSIRDKRKKLLYGPYECPKCGTNKLRIQVNKESKDVTGNCNCGLECTLEFKPAFESVDYYNKLIDQFRNRRQFHGPAMKK